MLTPEVTRITHYTQDYIDHLLVQFLKSFNEDPLPFALKLKRISISKGAYSDLINQKRTPHKRTIESMRAFIEKRVPKFLLVSEKEKYCGSCEEIYLNAAMKDPWICKKCFSQVVIKSKKSNGYYIRYNKIRYKKILAPGIERERYLLSRRRYHLKRNYGSLAKCMEMVKKLRKEIVFSETP